jgi:hypothetical protein
MLPMGQLIEELWEIRRFHLWYMEAAKAGLCNFIVKVSAEYFNLTNDQQIIVFPRHA